jgi:hypothetical protein
MLNVKGQVVSEVGVGPKGAGFKVMIPELGDVFRVFIPTEKLNGQQSYKMGDQLDIVVRRFYPRKNEVGAEFGDIKLSQKK